MKQGISAAAAALNLTPLDWTGNLERIHAAIALAKGEGIQLLNLPELCITGYGCEDMFFAEWVAERAAQQLEYIIPATKGLVVCVGLPFRHNNALFNGAALLANGELLGITAKKHMANSGVHYEARWFTPWPVGTRAEVTISGRTVPVGDLLFDFDTVRIGFEICEDAWVTPRHACELAARGVTTILNPSASHFALKKRDVVVGLARAAAKELGVSYLYANIVGCESGRTVFGGDTLIASEGEICAAGPRFSAAGVVFTTATISLPSTPPPEHPLSVRCSFRFTPVSQTKRQTQKSTGWDSSVTVKGSKNSAAKDTVNADALPFEEFTRAVALGLFDYMRKSGSAGFTLSLSGGADSAAIAALVYYMHRIVLAELSPGELEQRLKYNPTFAREFRARIPLTCAYQGTKNSSEITRTAAREVAAAVGATFFDLDIAPLTESYVKLVEGVTGKPLTWKDDDLALQNIQARVRSPGIWLLANVSRSLLLTTANRSEASVGYATMDGDTSGGLAPIGGIDKHFIRCWLRWVETEGPAGLGALPIMKLVNEQEPTAELRPAEQKQTDEKDLMPYAVLVELERLAIRDKASPTEFAKKLHQLLGSSYSAEELTAWSERFIQLWRQSQWKRERYAPAFHLDDFSVDPKSWCRYPILSGKW